MSFYGILQKERKEILDESSFSDSCEGEFKNTIEHMLKYAATRDNEFYQSTKWFGSIITHRNILINNYHKGGARGSNDIVYNSVIQNINLYKNIIARIKRNYDYIDLSKFENGIPGDWPDIILKAGKLKQFLYDNAANDTARSHANNLSIVTQSIYDNTPDKEQKYCLIEL